MGRIAGRRLGLVGDWGMKPLNDQELRGFGVGVEHHFGGGVYVKETFIPFHTELRQHAHEHDHLSYLVKGVVELTVDGVTREVLAPACILVEAGKAHSVRAVVDATWLCIWATDCTDPETVDEATARPLERV